MEQEQRIIVEIGWVGDDALLVKEIDRTAREGQVVIFQGGVKEGTVVRELGRSGEEGDDGWIDHVCRFPINDTKAWAEVFRAKM